MSVSMSMSPSPTPEFVSMSFTPRARTMKSEIDEDAVIELDELSIASRLATIKSAAIPVALDSWTASRTISRKFFSRRYGGNNQKLLVTIGPAKRELHDIRYAIFLTKRWNSALPVKPGKHGLAFFSWPQVYRETPLSVSVPLFVRHGQAEWQYMGEYRVREVEPLTAVEWRNQSQRTRRVWLDEGYMKLSWGELPRARCLFRKMHGRCPTAKDRWEVRSLVDLGSWRQITREEMEAALDSGEERIPVCALECVKYRADFQEELIHGYTHDTEEDWRTFPLYSSRSWYRVRFGTPVKVEKRDGSSLDEEGSRDERSSSAWGESRAESESEVKMEQEMGMEMELGREADHWEDADPASSLLAQDGEMHPPPSSRNMVLARDSDDEDSDDATPTPTPTPAPTRAPAILLPKQEEHDPHPLHLDNIFGPESEYDPESDADTDTGEYHDEGKIDMDDMDMDDMSDQRPFTGESREEEQLQEQEQEQEQEQQEQQEQQQEQQEQQGQGQFVDWDAPQEDGVWELVY